MKGNIGESRLNIADDANEDDDNDQSVAEEVDDSKPRGIGALNVPNRLIYAIDLRNDPDPQTYIAEIERLAEIMAVPLVQLLGFGERSSSPIMPNASTVGELTSAAGMAPSAKLPAAPVVISGEDVRRRWYPVIDYSRCTNCMECIDFCLFGVYGVDLLDRILVEQEDNCKKGCPACSRVCPANAIVFPEHKTPGIAGAEGGPAEDFKIDLSKLFGAPSALEMAVLERDVELVADGRAAVGVSVGIPKRQSGLSTKPRDSLDDLMDGLDSLDI